VTVAYVLAREITPRDTLSATFVTLLCLSPTLYTGLRRGLSQLAASVLGGLATLAVTVPLGSGPAALALSMALGLGASVLIGFASTYTVAGFTVLYVSLLGKGSVDAYFVRLGSVLLGVGVASGINFLVSAFSYGRIFGRRVGVAARAAHRPVALLAAGVRERDRERLRRADEALGPVFRLLEELRGEFRDLRRELRLRRGWSGVRIREVMEYDRIVERLVLVCHHSFDLVRMLRELYLEPEGTADVEALEVMPVLDAVEQALAACARRLRGEAAAMPPGIRHRYDPRLRKVAGRVAAGDPGGVRLDLALSIVIDLDNLQRAAARLVDQVEDLRPAAPSPEVA